MIQGAGGRDGRGKENEGNYDLKRQVYKWAQKKALEEKKWEVRD